MQILAQDLGVLKDANVASELRKILQGKARKQDRETRYGLELRDVSGGSLRNADFDGYLYLG